MLLLLLLLVRLIRYDLRRISQYRFDILQFVHNQIDERAYDVVETIKILQISITAHTLSKNDIQFDFCWN
jgi:hypothetical protein